jgi:beta-mannanase
VGRRSPSRACSPRCATCRCSALSTGAGKGGGAETITAGQIARGAGDSFLVALNEALAAWGKPIYVRPLAEMNGHRNAYCAFDANGSPRSADHSTAAYRKAFARISLFVHGGPGVNARLRQLGLPPVAGPLASNRQARVVWNPQGYGSPDLAGNSAESYYPGDAYVDVAGDDLHDRRGKAEWAAADALYRAHPGKPFAFPEWVSGASMTRASCQGWPTSCARTRGPS